MFKKLKENRGALVFEATIVFPVAFLVVFLILYMGNAYLQKAKVEAIVTKAVIKGAARCADPMVSHIEENGTIPPLETVEIMPYRYLASTVAGMDDITGAVESEITTKISEMDAGFFKGMEPVGYDSITVTYKTIFVASSLEADIDYKIVFPMRWWGETENLSMTVKAHYSVPVGDTPEFIRNVNMVEDFMEVTGASGAITDMTDKVTGFLRDDD